MNNREALIALARDLGISNKTENSDDSKNTAAQSFPTKDPESVCSFGEKPESKLLSNLKERW